MVYMARWDGIRQLGVWWSKLSMKGSVYLPGKRLLFMPLLSNKDDFELGLDL